MKYRKKFPVDMEWSSMYGIFALKNLTIEYDLYCAVCAQPNNTKVIRRKEIAPDAAEGTFTALPRHGSTSDSTSSGRTASPSQHACLTSVCRLSLPLPGFCRRWPDGLELFSRIISGIWTLLWTTSSAC